MIIIFDVFSYFYIIFSGESAFHAMMHMWAFAKIPIVRKMHRLNPNTRLTMLFGSKSWVDNSIGYSIQRDQPILSVDVHVCIFSIQITLF